jgi:hypothetical protein
VQVLAALEQAQHDLATPLAPVLGDEGVEGFLPFGGLLGILVGVGYRVRVLVVHRHR